MKPLLRGKEKEKKTDMTEDCEGEIWKGHEYIHTSEICMTEIEKGKIERLM